MSQILKPSNFYLVIKKPIVLLALSFISQSAMAEWSYFGKTVKGEIYFVDQSTFRGDQLRRGWFLVNQKDGLQGYKSEKQLWIANCKQEQLDIIQYTSYSEGMGEGFVVVSQSRNGPPNFTYPAPESMMESILKSLCLMKR